MSKQEYTIAVDFDGTLCENAFPEIGAPKERVIEYIKQQAAAGAKIILHTCRENGTKRLLLDEAIEFCIAHNIPLCAVNENPTNPHPEKYGSPVRGRKLYADLYVDDKAMSVNDIETRKEREEVIEHLRLILPVRLILPGVLKKNLRKSESLASAILENLIKKTIKLLDGKSVELQPPE